MATTGPRPTEGWVYILTNPAWPGYVKVGSSHDAASRLRSYQTSSPFRDFTLEGLAFVPDRWAFERSLHDALRGHRVGTTEWFRVHPQDAKGILNKLRKELA